MAIVFKEEKTIDGRSFPFKVYKAENGIVTRTIREQADAIDIKIEEAMRKIERELSAKGLLEDKGKKGSLELWYEVGKGLQFIDGLDISAWDKRMVWRALYDHAGKLAPGPLPERAKKNPERNHFHYCYELAKYSFDFVESAGDWSSWVEFFDSEAIRSDKRILDWIAKKAKEMKVTAFRGWIRPLTKSIRNTFMGRDTTLLPDGELENELQSAFSEAFKDKVQ